MDLDTFRMFAAIGLLLNSALYLVGCLVLGVILGDLAVCKLAVAALGITYLSYFSIGREPGRVDWPHTAARVFTYFSIAFGFSAGVLLLLW